MPVGIKLHTAVNYVCNNVRPVAIANNKVEDQPCDEVVISTDHVAILFTIVIVTKDIYVATVNTICAIFTGNTQI